MVRSFLKKTCVTLLSATILMSSFGTKAYTATYVSGSAGGVSTYGSLSMGSTVHLQLQDLVEWQQAMYL